MTPSRLLVDVQAKVMTLTLNRPEKLNAIDNALAGELLSALEAAATDDTVHTVLVLGKGRAFCAGRDVSAPPTEQDLTLVQAVSRSIVNLAKPVVFGVHGWTVGAGLEWMLNADLVIAGANCRFKLPEASLGVFVTGGISASLPAYAGLARAKAMVLLGEEFNADAAQAWGLVWQVSPEQELEKTSREFASKLARLRPDLVRQIKRVFNEVGLGQFERALDLESLAQRAIQANVSE